MARIINSTDQLSISIELYGRSSSDPQWITGSIAQQYYLPRENQFHAFIEGYIEVYEADLSRLLRELRTFLEIGGECAALRFVPEAEPTFELTFERISRAHDCQRVVSAAVDLATFAEITSPSVYGDNRVAVRFATTEDRLQKFGEDLLKDAGKIKVYAGGVPGRA